MDPRIDEQHAVLGAALACIPIVGGAKAINAASLDVDARDFGTVVRGEDRELDRATPGVRRENCADVLVAWTPFFFVAEARTEPNVRAKKKKKEEKKRQNGCGWAGLVAN
jgi:hypothetical protein